jgi:hypothetical protein
MCGDAAAQQRDADPSQVGADVVLEHPVARLAREQPLVERQCLTRRR